MGVEQIRRGDLLSLENRTTHGRKQSALAHPCAGRGMVEPPGATGPTGDWEKLYATSDVATLPWWTRTSSAP